MSSNKLLMGEAMERKQSVGPNDTEPQDSNSKSVRRNNYSWWNWRRSTDSGDKKSPPKIVDDNKSMSESINSDTNKEGIISMEDDINIPTTDFTPIDSIKEGELNEDVFEKSTISIDHVDAMSSNNKNDDSISSELADISKTSGSGEKYRKTLRLTSDQIVS